MPRPAPQRYKPGDWPPHLAELPKPPEVLYLAGCLPAQAGVAVVGARHPTPAAERFAEKLAGELAAAGICVISGGAKGIDAAAHRGALARGGSTLVVAPSGWYRAYPTEHADLYRRIVDAGGGYLSLCEPHSAATQGGFFPRNACLVALSDAVVVVQAAFRSGARNAAKHARRLSRKLFVVPSAPWVSKGKGCILELRAGASLLESAKDVLAYLAAANLHPKAGQLALGFAAPLTTGTAASRVLAALRAGARSVDAVCQATRLSVGEVQAEILALRLQGLVALDPSGALRLLGP